MPVSKIRLLTVALVVCLVPVAASAGGSEHKFTTNVVRVGKQQVKVLETVDKKGASIRVLPAGVGDTVVFDTLNQELSRRIDTRMKAKVLQAEDVRLKAQAEEMRVKAEAEKMEVTDKSSAAKDVRPLSFLIRERSGSQERRSGNSRSWSYHSGVRVEEWNGFTLTAAGASSGSWSGTETPQHIILRDELCFSGISLTISWPPSLQDSGRCGSYESEPWTDTGYVSQEYSDATASSFFKMYSTIQRDSAVVRIRNRDYRPASQVPLNYGL